jgi:hypothetical protein
MASSDIPRSRRISREIRGIHGAEGVDGPRPLFSGPQGRSIVMSSRLALSLIAAFPQSWPDPISRNASWIIRAAIRPHHQRLITHYGGLICRPPREHGQITPTVSASRCVVLRVSLCSKQTACQCFVSGRTRAKFGRLLPAVHLQCFKRLNFLGRSCAS